MTLVSRRDIGKILVAGSTGLALGAQNAFGAMHNPVPEEADPEGGKPKRPAKPGPFVPTPPWP